MDKIIHKYRKIFLSTFFLSAFTFGGGYVIVPLMRKKFVEDYNWITEDEMLDLIAIAQSSPGAIAINASIIIGYKLDGFLGAMVAVIGTTLPPLIIISIISLFYIEFKQNLIISHALKGMQVGVASVITDVVIRMAIDIKKQNDFLLILIMIIVFFLTNYINIMVIIILTGIFGIIISKFRKKGERK